MSIVLVPLFVCLFLDEPFFLFLDVMASSTLENGSVRVEGIVGALVLSCQVFTLVSVHMLANAKCDQDE